MNLTPILPRKPAFPSLGPTTFAPVVASITSPFWLNTTVARNLYHIWPRCVNIHWTQMTDQKRPYRKKRRAELEAETRQRITESAIELHGTLGPANTSISAVAEGAGVRRSTVYRHFPDEAALFAACTSHWTTANPPPDIGSWAAIASADVRLRRALQELYG